jgi:hypothetical protein
MERINLKTQKVCHYDILTRIEAKSYDRQAYLSASIWDLKQQISQYETQLQNETDDLKATQNEMRQVETESDAIMKAGSHFETVELIRTAIGHEYFVIQYETDQKFSFGYVSGGTFHIAPMDFESQNEAFEAVSKRDRDICAGVTPMF